MDSRLNDVLQGKEDNYLFPFYWQHGNHTELIPEQVERIFNSGCRALCVESRPHPDFCGDGWWRDMDIILREAKKRDMQVWLLDDDQFPTGHAGGLIETKYPHLRQWTVIETHVDVCGPMKDGAVIFQKENEENILIGAYAYKRYYDEDERCEFEGIDLRDCIDFENGYINWDVPDGVWRIFCYYKSRRGGKKGYIDMINPESVRVLIDAVYESHYEHYKDYFGNTFVGFFTDEPCFGNEAFTKMKDDRGFYDAKLGTPGLSFPWNETVEERMTEKLGFSPVPYLNLLWYEDDGNGDKQSEIRYAYMDTITELYNECFTKQLADWSHEHGVMYIGHIIEDMNCHTRGGVGHFFRALEWQDMSGMDIVLHQIMPGMEHLVHTATCGQNFCGGEFFHYIIGKLCASLAHLTPHMKGRAMCEVFGAFGYGEDSPFMKYMMDYLLVRGMNYFVPHAFSSKYPDHDCPPHFGAEGHDPSFDAFCELMKYTNKAAHLLYGGVHKANAAILYHVDGEWASRYDNAMTMEPIATRLYDAHIDFDIVWSDILDRATVKDGKLCIHEESFDCLVIPYADHMPRSLLEKLGALIDKGAVLFFINGLPENASFKSEVLTLDELVPTMQSRGMTDVTVDGDFPLLRIYHTVRDGQDIFMLVNEDVKKSADTTLHLPVSGEYARIDLLGELYTSGRSEGGELRINLLPNQSQIIIFGSGANFDCEYKFTKSVEFEPSFKLELAHSSDLSDFKCAGEFSEFFNITSPKFDPNFSGLMRYSFKINAQRGGRKILLDLGGVGQNAKLSLNGRELGIRISQPYAFDVTDALVDGENEVVVTVGNTLVRDTPDYFSRYLLLAPSGLFGKISLEYFD